MSKVDCSNIFNFMSEWERRRKTENKGSLGTCESSRICLSAIGTKDVENLQKWSDEHPQLTRKEKYFTMCKDEGLEELLTECSFGMPIALCPELDCRECKAYWRKVVE